MTVYFVFELNNVRAWIPEQNSPLPVKICKIYMARRGGDHRSCYDGEDKCQIETQ